MGCLVAIAIAVLTFGSCVYGMAETARERCRAGERTRVCGYLD